MGQFDLEELAVDYTEVLPCSFLTPKALKKREEKEKRKPKIFYLMIAKVHTFIV